MRISPSRGKRGSRAESEYWWITWTEKGPFALLGTISSHLKIGHPKKNPKRKRIVFQPSIFRCELLVSGVCGT